MESHLSIPHRRFYKIEARFANFVDKTTSGKPRLQYAPHTHCVNGVPQVVDVDNRSLENAQFAHAFGVNAECGQALLEDVEGLKQRLRHH